MIIRLDTQKTERQGTAQCTNKTFTTKTPLLAPPYYQDIDHFLDDVYDSEEIQIFSAEIHSGTQHFVCDEDIQRKQNVLQTNPLTMILPYKNCPLLKRWGTRNFHRLKSNWINWYPVHPSQLNPFPPFSSSAEIFLLPRSSHQSW